VLKTSNFTQIYEKTYAASHNTEFWIDPKRHIDVVMMQVLRFTMRVPFESPDPPIPQEIRGAKWRDLLLKLVLRIVQFRKPDLALAKPS
jgi:hypothetical protein